MCKDNCNCNTVDDSERMNAVKRRIATMRRNGRNSIADKCNSGAVDSYSKIKAINKKLFDGITKIELVDSIIDADMLSFNKLVARDDVKAAIEATKEIRSNAMVSMVQLAGRVHAAERTIEDHARILLDDILIEGSVPHDIKKRLAIFEDVISKAIDSI